MLVGSDRINTQFVVTKYSNMTFVLITQTGKMGSLLRATKKPTEEYLLGDRTDLVPMVYLTELFDRLKVDELLLGLSLKQEQDINEIMDIVLQLEI
ncbi:hypothetical protein HK103_005598 [Boothiomyces macroporosus]|uniref:Proteasome assembly chaperone 3 n=1 Tax=Boothiomyces macroporosus TaxID=261099 RepID=A0AAD5Y7D4_9FUNG|nr:hypothetical protein HK103_005598 [Boothiomyces macroporosus]